MRENRVRCGRCPRSVVLGAGEAVFEVDPGSRGSRFDIQQVGHSAVLSDPQGAVFGVVNPRGSRSRKGPSPLHAMLIGYCRFVD